LFSARLDSIHSANQKSTKEWNKIGVFFALIYILKKKIKF
jgi:hypothetical protein